MNENRQKLSQRIKRYLKNLMKALFGLDPYQDEVDVLKEQLEKSAENMSAMQDQLYSALEKWDKATKNWESSLAQVRSLQQLTENLRERIADKDKMIAQLEKELSKK
jgi:chromosome segregation ATPase